MLGRARPQSFTVCVKSFPATRSKTVYQKGKKMFRRDFVAHFVGAVVAWVSGVFGKQQHNEGTDRAPYPNDVIATPRGDWWRAWIKMKVGGEFYARAVGQLNIALALVHVPTDRIVKWIPVCARLPNLKMRLSQAHHAEWLGDLNSSVGFMVTIGHFTHSVYRVLAYQSGEEFWAWDMDGKERVCDGLITHWAELPAPPDETAAPESDVPFRNFTARYTNIDKEKFKEVMREAIEKNALRGLHPL